MRRLRDALAWQMIPQVAMSPEVGLITDVSRCRPFGKRMKRLPRSLTKGPRHGISPPTPPYVPRRQAFSPFRSSDAENPRKPWHRREHEPVVP